MEKVLTSIAERVCYVIFDNSKLLYMYYIYIIIIYIMSSSKHLKNSSWDCKNHLNVKFTVHSSCTISMLKTAICMYVEGTRDGDALRDALHFAVERKPVLM